MRQKIKFIKEILNDKVYRSIIVLGFYIVFFLIIFLFLSSNKKVPKTILNPIDSYLKMTSYDYKITYTKDITKTITGTYYNNNNYFIIDTDSYKYINNALYKNNIEINKNELFIDVLKFNNKDIYNLIKKSILDSTITYSDHKRQIYNLKSFDYYNWYNASINNNTNNILLILTIENNKITNLEIDATNDFKIEINYQNINEVKKVDE